MCFLTGFVFLGFFACDFCLAVVLSELGRCLQAKTWSCLELVYSVPAVHNWDVLGRLALCGGCTLFV